MLRGFYSSAAGMLAQLNRQDVIANNLANVNTPGYKRKTVSFSAFSAELQKAGGEIAPGTTTAVIPTMTIGEDTRPGRVQVTGSPANVALEGPGSFVIQGSNGEHLVRGGDFRLDSKGQLVDSNGDPVLGQRGPIQITGSEWNIDSDGNVHSGSAVIDQLRIEKGSDTTPVRVVAGALESSNVNTVEEMVTMITGLRAYEACQRTILSLDQTLDKAINQMGR